MAQLRLDKYLADMGIGTRSQIKEAAKKGPLCQLSLLLISFL